ncbi:hypothetical protein IG193_08915 [Infirmifilum lucidum]|uniref:Uncharacterized protein n=1 Tax=Infirmifilum lucidum TaxID=2776706 RepID=A0A7L9FGC3_9CREN|nr:hypothetical protein [Infirmifilum lucidum]QOJ78850.1 hypothetical protein IG193_08915 [Infirmifilum lucidum]
MYWRLTLLALFLLFLLAYSSAVAVPSGSYMVYRIDAQESGSGVPPFVGEEAVAIISRNNPRIKLLVQLSNFTDGSHEQVCYIGAGGGEIRIHVLSANSSFYTVQYAFILYNATLACKHEAQSLGLFRGVEWVHEGNYLVAQPRALNITRLRYVSARDNGVYDEGGNLLGEWLFWLPEATLKQGYTLVLAHLHPAKISPELSLEGCGVAVLLGVNFSKAVKGPGYRVGNVVIPPTSLVQGSTVRYGLLYSHVKCEDRASRDYVLSLYRTYVSPPPELKEHVADNSIWTINTAMTSFNVSGAERKPWRLVPSETTTNVSGVRCVITTKGADVELSGRLFLVPPLLYSYEALWDRSTGVLVELSQELTEFLFSSETPAVLSEYLGFEGKDAIYTLLCLNCYLSVRLVDTNVLKPPSYLGSPGRPDTRVETAFTALILVGVLACATGAMGYARSILKQVRTRHWISVARARERVAGAEN